MTIQIALPVLQFFQTPGYTGSRPSRREHLHIRFELELRRERELEEDTWETTMARPGVVDFFLARGRRLSAERERRRFWANRRRWPHRENAGGLSNEPSDPGAWMSFVREQEGSPEEPGAGPRGQERHHQDEDPDTEVAPRVEGVEGPRTYAELFNQIGRAHV